jgi:hypothetical protein
MLRAWVAAEELRPGHLHGRGKEARREADESIDGGRLHAGQDLHAGRQARRQWELRMGSCRSVGEGGKAEGGGAGRHMEAQGLGRPRCKKKEGERQCPFLCRERRWLAGDADEWIRKGVRRWR